VLVGRHLPLNFPEPYHDSCNLLTMVGTMIMRAASGVLTEVSAVLGQPFPG
jgi:hypothetical protein